MQVLVNIPKTLQQKVMIDKSSGRVIGVIVNNVFYVVWLDPHHNLTDSEGYGTVKKYPAPA